MLGFHFFRPNLFASMIDIWTVLGAVSRACDKNQKKEEIHEATHILSSLACAANRPNGSDAEQTGLSRAH